MELPPNEIHLHCIRTERVADADLIDSYKAMLTDHEHRQMSRFYYEAHRHQFLLTRALLRCGLSQYQDVDPADWRFERNEFDKPFVAGPSSAKPIKFNISHAQGLVICAFSARHEIGADVEYCQRQTGAAFQRLASYFSETEIDALKRLPETHQRQRIFDLWTHK